MAKTFLQVGDVIFVDRGLYKHFGVYIGNGRVIHYCGDKGFLLGDVCIRETSIERFLDGATTCSRLEIINPGNKFHVYSPEETIKRARSQVDTKNYDVFGKNCEHFAYWCKFGVKHSGQVNTAKELFEALTELAREYEKIKRR